MSAALSQRRSSNHVRVAWWELLLAAIAFLIAVLAL